MKKILCFLLPLLLLASCDHLGNEPTVTKPTLHFNRDGGEKGVDIIKSNGDEYSGKAPWKYRPSDNEQLETKPLGNGDLVHYNEWVSFIVPYQFQYIKVKVKKNLTGKRRSFTFIGRGGKVGFTLTVIQEG